MGFYGKKTAFIVGNAESRKEINLNFLREKGIIYGCNALYRDFYPEVLVSIDEAMTKEIIDSNYPGYHIHRVFMKDRNKNNNLDLIDSDGRKVTQTKGWSSGATAAWIASKCVEFDTIYLIGFDLFKTERVNNVYKDTPNYVASTARPITTQQFRLQLIQVMQQAPYKKFVWVNNYHKQIFDNCNNVSLMMVNEFKNKFGC